MKVVALILCASIGISCAGDAGEKARPASSCARDADCSPKVCVAGSCVSPRTLSPQWMLELTPPVDVGPDKTMAPLTELTTPIPGSLADIPTFTLDMQAAVTVTLTYAATASVPATAHILLSIPSAIPGRPDLTLEVPASTDTAGTKVSAVPSLKLGQPATLTVAPLSSSDSGKVPPRPFPVTLGASLKIDVKADLSIRGKLLNPFGDLLSDTFVARAFQQGRAVSNRPTVDAMDGSFLLLVPANVAATPFVVDLEPQTSVEPNAWFRSNPMQLTDNVILPTFAMAPYLKTGNQFRVAVQGEDAGMPVVPGALVRALTVIPPADATQTILGSTNFLRDVVTVDDGAANTTLVPGTANGNQIYEFAVIPPAGSPYATTCLPQQPVGAGTTPPAPPANLPTIVLPRRPVFSGTLFNKTGAPVANATVTATPTADPIPSCTTTMTRASPGSTLTDADGRFKLQLDPGTYQLDYDPPAGSAVPRLSERSPFPISGDVNRTITLPAAAVVKGQVFRPDGTKLVGATVRIFEPRCASSVDCVPPPWLIAEAQSDKDGFFRAIVPAGSN
jgi:hypothetical protein